MSDKKEEVKVTEVKPSEEAKKNDNWGDMVDDDEDDDRELPPHPSDKQASDVKAKAKGKRWEEPPKEKKNYGPPQQRTKNERGDYVVTKIVIKDRKEENLKVI
jgi:hypothetical protein